MGSEAKLSMVGSVALVAFVALWIWANKNQPTMEIVEASPAISHEKNLYIVEESSEAVSAVDMEDSASYESEEISEDLQQEEGEVEVTEGE